MKTQTTELPPGALEAMERINRFLAAESKPKPKSRKKTIYAIPLHPLDIVAQEGLTRPAFDTVSIESEWIDDIDDDGRITFTEYGLFEEEDEGTWYSTFSQAKKAYANQLEWLAEVSRLAVAELKSFRKEDI